MTQTLKNVQRKRVLLGWLALAAPLPLPLNDVLEWPALFVYAVLVVRMIQRAQGDARRWLENRHLNVLGLVYLPILAIDLRYGMTTGRVLQPLLHLVLFVTLAKLWSLRRERDKWHVFIAVFVIFLAAMATSTHLTVVLYLLAGTGAGLYTLGELSRLHVVETVERTARDDEDDVAVDETAASAPRRRRIGWNTALTILICLVAIPLFAALPRLREPLIMGGGQGLLGGGSATGFSDSVDLSLTSAVRDNPSVALRIEAESPLGDTSDLRLKGGGFSHYRDNRWLRESTETSYTSRQGTFRLARGDVENRLTIYQEPLATRSLLLPLNAVRVETRKPIVISIWLGGGGVVRFPGLPRRQTSVYVVETTDETRLLSSSDPMEPALDVEGLSPRIAELAAEVMSGGGTDRERIARLERHLLSSYEYTLDFVGRDGQRPVEDFLFTYRSGHCEYFATAMVLMLRSQGIPARFVTGFLGAEANRLEGFYVVRQSNAHAWVEAWTEDGGWEVYDPTPPEGRPGTRQQSLRLFVQQVWDYLAFRWDRYVLTFGAEDQRGIVESLRDRFRELWRSLFGDDAEDAETTEPVPADPGAIEVEDDRESTGPGQRPLVRYGGLALLVLVGVGAWLILRRRPPTPEVAYATLRDRLGEAGFGVDDATPPLALRRAGREALRDAGDSGPDAVRAVDRVVDLYVATAFAERSGDDDMIAGLADDLRTIERAIDVALKARRRAERRIADRAA